MMAIETAQIAGIVQLAEAAFPGAVLKMYYGPTQGQVVNVLRSDSQQHNSEDTLDGIMAGVRGRLRLILSRCDPWEPPADGDTITLHTSSDVLIGTYGILGHVDDPTDPPAVRTLLYGEVSA